MPQLLLMMEVVPEALERREFRDVEEIEVGANLQSIIQTVSGRQQREQRVRIR